jgi:hypothetical protein
MTSAMARFVEFVKRYPGPEQVDLCVEIEVPGSWFGGTEMGSLNATTVEDGIFSSRTAAQQLMVGE